MVTPISPIGQASRLGARPGTRRYLFGAGERLGCEEDSLTEKAIKYKVYEESDVDSTLKKAAGLKATGEILDDEDDSVLKKAAKLKMLEDASK